jgi:hypothetical protein
MRDPARIPEMCRLLQQAWERVPDQRLGQLLVNAIAPAVPAPPVFYAEEGAVRRGLERIAREGLPEPELPLHGEVAPEWRTLGEPAPTTVVLEGARVGHFSVDSLFCQVLEVRFAGEYRHGSEGTPDAEAMAQTMASLLVRASADVVLLDLSALRYAWGNTIMMLFEVIGRFDAEYPLGVSVLAGPLSVGGLTSLGARVHTDFAAALDDAKAQAVRRSHDIG